MGAALAAGRGALARVEGLMKRLKHQSALKANLQTSVRNMELEKNFTFPDIQTNNRRRMKIWS